MLGAFMTVSIQMFSESMACNTLLYFHQTCMLYHCAVITNSCTTKAAATACMPPIHPCTNANRWQQLIPYCSSFASSTLTLTDAEHCKNTNVNSWARCYAAVSEPAGHLSKWQQLYFHSCSSISKRAWKYKIHHFLQQPSWHQQHYFAWTPMNIK